jgi:hypothetical protein
VRRYGFPPEAGIVETFKVRPNDQVVPGRDLAELYDVKVENKIRTLMFERDSARREADEFEAQAKTPGLAPKDVREFLTQAAMKKHQAENKDKELRLYANGIGAQLNADPRGRITFSLKAPKFTDEESRLIDRREWTVLNSNFIEEWRGREAKASDPILRLGAKYGPHELELRIPQKHIGQVLAAMAALERENKPQVLDVDFLLRTKPEVTYKGKLHRDKIAGEANPNRDDKDEPEPVVLAYVRIEGDDIPAADRLPPEQLVSGAEVRAKVRCGNHRLGYSLFYGVWEFFYEKVVFFF